MSRRRMSVRALEATVTRLLAQGLVEPVLVREANGDPHGGLYRRYWRMKVAPWCKKPHLFTLFASQEADRKGRVIGTALALDVAVPCRNCDRCLKMRSHFWRDRALAEYKSNARSYFGTITLTPEDHYLLDARATARLAQQGVLFSALSDAEIFKERCREFGRELSLYLKRLRQGPGGHRKVHLRYLMIAEAHDSDKTSDLIKGRPHFHVMFHEPVPGTLVQGDPVQVLMHDVRDGELEPFYVKGKNGQWKRYCRVADNSFLRSQWKLGFTRFQFASGSHEATYMTKYLSKSMLYKVRASYRYGLAEGDVESELLEGTSEVVRPDLQSADANPGPPKDPLVEGGGGNRPTGSPGAGRPQSCRPQLARTV